MLEPTRSETTAREGFSRPLSFHESGVLLVDKPAGMTSMDVIRVIKRIARPKKIGHAGTLDPFATGLLPVLINSATRLSDRIMSGTKEYEGCFLLGMVFDTQDITGQQVGETKELPLDLDLQKVQEAAKSFVGEVQQTPPIYSAIKKQGKPLYFYARNNIDVEIQSRKVLIEDFQILRKDGDRRFYFSARVQKGTYIRTLIHDLGQALGVGAVLESLRRTRTSDFYLDEAVQLSTLKFASDIKSHLKTTEKRK